MNEVLTTNEVAELLRVHPKTIYHLARAGKIPGAQIGGKWRFLHDEIVAMMRYESNKAKGHLHPDKR